MAPAVKFSQTETPVCTHRDVHARRVVERPIPWRVEARRLWARRIGTLGSLQETLGSLDELSLSN